MFLTPPFKKKIFFDYINFIQYGKNVEKDKKC